MVYKVKYDSDADVMSIFVAEKGKFSHAEEMGDLVIHVDDKGKPLFIEVLHAKKLLPAMVQALTQDGPVTIKH